MYGLMHVAEMGFSVVLFVLAWLAGRQAARLKNGGSAERLQRKARKQLVRTAWLTVPALIVFGSIIWMIASLPSLFWQDRILLNVPLILAPLLAIWFTTVPMIWKLWKQSALLSGPLSAGMKNRLGSRLFVLPYQAAALGAVTSFYFGLVSPVPYDPLKVEAPIAIYVLAMAILWLHHDGLLLPVREWLRSKRQENRKAKSRTQA